MRKVIGRLEGLTEKYGFGFPPEEIEGLLANDNPGKPHIGNLMTKLGFAASKEDAIVNYINKVPIGLTHIRPEMAIEVGFWEAVESRFSRIPYTATAMI